jgi:threonine dehydrogenase-like Zn-dependent dehydrogenase
VTTDVVAPRRVMAEGLGADAALDPSRGDVRALLRAAVDRDEVDVAFDAVGIPATFDQAVEAVRPGGLVMAVGGWRTVPVDLSRLVTREIHVRGTFNYTPGEFAEALNWLVEGRPQARRIVTDVRRLADGPAVFEELAGGRPPAGKVVLVPANEAA